MERCGCLGGCDQGGEYSRKVQQQTRICTDPGARLGTVTCGDGRGWTCCPLFASRGSGVRAHLAPPSGLDVSVGAMFTFRPDISGSSGRWPELVFVFLVHGRCGVLAGSPLGLAVRCWPGGVLVAAACGARCAGSGQGGVVRLARVVSAGVCVFWVAVRRRRGGCSRPGGRSRR